MSTFTVHALPEDVASDARRSPGAVPPVAGDGPYPARCCLRDVEDADAVVLASVMPFRGETRMPPEAPCTSTPSAARATRPSVAPCR